MKAENKELYDLIQMAINRAKDRKTNILLSYVQEIDEINPLTFFTLGSLFKGTRFLWSEPSRNQYLVGLGHAYTISNDFSQQRFWAVQYEWQRLVDNQISNIELKPSSGIGPILFGGFSFDPDKDKTDLWKNYQEAKMVVPSYMLTINKGKTFLTFNVLIHANDRLEEVIKDMKEKEKIIFQRKTIQDNNENIVINKENINVESWLNSVAGVVSEIKQGYVNKVVLARELRLQMREKIEVATVLERLLDEQPKSYIFALECEEDCFIGASPELLVKKEKNEFKSMCLAGTIGRGKTPAEDEKLGNELLNDHKNLYEHALVVEMIKNAMEKGCEEVEIAKSPSLYDLKNVKHLHTPVKGLAKEGVTILDMVERLHPTPALGGYPKEISMNIIRKKEVLDRGWYAGPIGWLDSKCDGEFAVAIRSSLIKGNIVSLFAGGGIVERSNPAQEYQETEMKFKPMLSALRG
ncbi:isochorismate synthase [Desulfonispora thiosulfatigenes DSM 11270]|uniref:Isochorismate synthase MenF n=1 Tax=Desulfonispora thiosulfatigenes DSM 11270 TaxID=656914 RepID=A0A1W1UV52_DESTI|nr:isochorismate synthase [Desulfonispora thiosulfatigenes]SMB84977.1 isochorismate synthase [Desulfonispora thiosulfatigenes DSM 11270]